ncbi:hypothetical protein [Brachyspira hyodysenteriae]|uniref:hypothetical protein n=1 Tax=Brachyspira hyodysenteriae TaxID=159 RepID=UPI0022CD9698|nr:hypothetical protein [Brachyspira hyodysenteriae]MCZ9850202.1 hypothetical protein [Brachyspira hyodysenteriae]MCZ9878172.1 hypothetical protein [Brachyspira hyodysenteriae]MCZ9894620.1 hypothetical protein [Brachyspira hyodysenteriae]MCZ9898334.1 hypothetical protein [Brachyspira hyodysenteriae]MCZ9951846.1 hypothetical protein [Brachyspira hyodysenteriae]
MNIISKRKINKYRNTHRGNNLYICNTCNWQYDCISVCTKYRRCSGYEYNEGKYIWDTRRRKY